MRIKHAARAILAAIVMAAGMATAAVASAPVAGAAIVPCPGGSGGWFNTINGAVNCSWENNHIVADVYGPGGSVVFQGAIDMWYDSTYCQPNAFLDGATWGGKFTIKVISTSASIGCAAGKASQTYTYVTPEQAPGVGHVHNNTWVAGSASTWPSAHTHRETTVNDMSLFGSNNYPFWVPNSATGCGGDASLVTAGWVTLRPKGTASAGAGHATVELAAEPEIGTGAMCLYQSGDTYISAGYAYV